MYFLAHSFCPQQISQEFHHAMHGTRAIGSLGFGRGVALSVLQMQQRGNVRRGELEGAARYGDAMDIDGLNYEALQVRYSTHIQDYIYVC
jgi:hypothetical protein